MREHGGFDLAFRRFFVSPIQETPRHVMVAIIINAGQNGLQIAAGGLLKFL